MEKSYTLTVLNGPLARRSIRLPTGETRIGGDDPDLAVALEDAHTATLTVGTDGVRISTDARCWIDGAPAAAPDVAPLDRVIDLGGLAFVLRDSARSDAAPPSLKVPPRRNGRRARAAFAVLIASVAILAASALALERVLSAPATTASAIRQADLLSDIRKRFAPEGIVLSQDERGVVDIRGQCMMSSRLAALRDALRERGFVYRDSVICQDDMVNSVRAILRMNGYENATVESGATYGTVDISGRIDADERWQRVAEMLSGTAGLQSWTVRDRSGGSVNDLISRLRAAGLIGKLSIARARDDILVTGLLDATDKAALTAVIAAFRRDYSDASRVVVQDIAAAPSLNRVFPSAVVSFGGRPPSMFIELADGTRLMVGSRLPGDYAITGLDANGVDLSKDGEIAHFPLNL
ncbi:type III secretion system inner membrane ring subunit SctD [Burkholderia sp. WSM2232]|uniref:type III secretion system inner membrane ring subunit SctD n=1 Tax=Burkholderia sp. WSM2232 TaxID=944436 RepID=UPI0004225C60|nr:type III secretion system inner membrane ring subunit SctD [Burkholderia sp. WSM2232]